MQKKINEAIKAYNLLDRQTLYGLQKQLNNLDPKAKYLSKRFKDSHGRPVGGRMPTVDEVASFYKGKEKTMDEKPLTLERNHVWGLAEAFNVKPDRYLDWFKTNLRLDYSLREDVL